MRKRPVRIRGDETQGLEESCDTFIITGLCFESVVPSEVCDGPHLSPWPRAAGEGPTGRKHTRPDNAAVSENNVPPFKSDVISFARAPNANHIPSIDPKGRGQIASSPGYRLDTSCRNCSFTLRHTTSSTSPVPGANARSLPVTPETTIRKARELEA